jgi:CheY-like chemotaxis protein
LDQRPHIVVVEDEAVQRQMLADYLARQNFRVSALGDGAALRRLVERELPALVMLDVGLPGEDGFALARWLRERSGRVGIIMVTAAADTVDRVVGLETGADDYIASPSSRASFWRGSRACCGGPPGRRPRARGCASAGGCSTSSAECWSTRMMAARSASPRASSIC